MCNDARIAPGRFEAVYFCRYMGGESGIASRGHGALDRRVVAANEALDHLRSL
jgi:hypothetical protein